MSFKKVIPLILVTVFMLCVVSCSQDRKTKNNGVDISIYVMDNDASLRNAITRYNGVHESGKIRETVFYADQSDEYGKKLKTGLAAGNGPDILMCRQDLLPGLPKYLEAAALTDLDELMKNDSGYKQEDYFEKVMNCGLYKGKRYFVPLGFTFDVLFSTQKILTDNGIKPGDADLTLNRLADAAKRFQTDVPDKAKYLVSQIKFSTLMKYSMNSFVDDANKKAAFDSPEFAGMLDYYKRLFPAMVPQDQMKVEFSDKGLSSLLKDNCSVFLEMPVYSPRLLSDAYSAFDTEVEPVMIPMPDSGENFGTVARPTYMAGIRSGCKNKGGAYEFIKSLLSDEFQSGDVLLGIPVNRAAYGDIRDQCIKNNAGGSGLPVSRGGGCKSDASARTLFTSLDHIINNMTGCRIVDGEMDRIIDDSLDEFMKDGGKAGETVKSMQTQVTAYLASPLPRSGEKAPEQVEGNTKAVSELRIMYMYYQTNVKNAIRIYNEKHPEVKINTEVFASSNYELYRNKLATEILSGEGPDIFVFCDGDFNCLNKVVANGVFCDLNPLIEKDGEFNTGDYTQKVLDYGVYDGKRYYIPLRYDVPFLVTTKGILEKNDIHIDETGWTWDDFLKTARKYMNRNTGSDRYFTGGSMFLQMFLQNSGLKLVDYDSRKTAFNSPEFVELLKCYKDVLSVTMPIEKQVKTALPARLLKNGNAALEIVRGDSDPAALGTLNSLYRAVLNENIVIYPMPSFKKAGQVFSNIDYSAAINSKCRNKDMAFDFVKVLLSKSIQKYFDDHGAQNTNFGAPVNKAAFDEDMEYFSHLVTHFDFITSNGTLTESYTQLSIPEDVGGAMHNLVQKAEKSELVDINIIWSISKEVDAFTSGEKTAVQAAKDMDEKVTLYLNE